MFRKLVREIGFRFLALYAVLEESYVERLEKNGYIEKDSEFHKRRLTTVQAVLKKLRNEGF
nr:MAG TPA: Ftsk gamma domain [Caudoviricetes sp.]